MKLTTTSNNDLQILSNHLKLKLQGILMSDELYDFMDKGIPDGNYILNLEDSQYDGSHWMGMIKDRDIIYYMDSLGTQSCGYWVILFLYCMNKKSKLSLIEKFKAFNKLWTEDVNLNEKLLEKAISKLFKNKI